MTAAMSPATDGHDPTAPGADLGDVILDALSGRERAPADLPSDDELRARVLEGDPTAAAQAVVAVYARQVPLRVATAVAAERAPVVLLDGSTVSVEEAERLLAHAEAERAHVALRQSLERALAPFAGATHPGSGRLQDFGTLHDNALAALGLTSTPPATEPWAAFLRATRELTAAALGVLTIAGREAVVDARTLARALDLPDASGAYSQDAVTALAREARDTLPRTARPLARFGAPRGLVGLVLESTLPDAPVRVASVSGRRVRRHLRSLEGVATGLAVACGGPRSLGCALGLSFLEERVRVQVLGAARSDARRHVQVLRATTLLQTQIAVAVALSMARHGNEPEAHDEAVADLLGVRAGIPWGVLEPPWPHGGALEVPADRLHGLAQRVGQLMAAPGLTLQLREHFDVDHVLSRKLWSALADGEWAAWIGAAAPDAATASAAWSTWLAEVL